MIKSNWLAIFLLLITTTGCVTQPIPNNYSGPIATFRDTALSESSTRAQFYFLSEIDGKKIDNILFATRQANAGKGFSLTPVTYSRDIPATLSVLKLEARIGYGAPIQELLNSSTVYTAESIISFKPESNKTYVVKGELSDDKKEVWLEEADTGKRVATENPAR